MESRSTLRAVAALVVSALAVAPAHAEMSAEELAKFAQNPVGNLISLPLQNNTNLNFGPERGTQNILNIQPVIPISVSEEFNVITRTIVPVISMPPLFPCDDRRMESAIRCSRRSCRRRIPVNGSGVQDPSCRSRPTDAKLASNAELSNDNWGLGPPPCCSTSTTATPGCTARWSTTSGR